MEYETNPIRAIRKHCLDCCCGSSEEVKACTIETCYLFPFRQGKNPFRTKREYTEEQKEAMRSRLAEVRKTQAKNND